jgi:hypothetical protein
MSSLIPILTATPGTTKTYNFGMAETFSWVPIQTQVRPLFARATYSVNLKDNEGIAGFDFLQAGVTYYENYICIHTITSTTIGQLTALNSSFGAIGGGAGTNLFATPLPPDFKLRGHIKGITLTSGSAIGYK